MSGPAVDPRRQEPPAPRRQEPRTPPRGSVQIARFYGVPVFLSGTWLLIAAFVTVGFADLFRQTVDNATGATPYLLAFAFAVLSALCVLAHELGHVVAALALGLRVRSVFIFLLGGVTELDPEPRRASHEFVVSLAGPLVSGALGGLALAGAEFSPPGSAILVELQVLCWSNLVIAAFNILPGLPLDGGRVLRAVVWGVTGSRTRATIVAAWAGRVIAVAVAIGGLLIQRGNWAVTGVVISAAMGAFLWFAASQSLVASRAAARLPALAVHSLLRRAIWVPGEMPVDLALRRLWAEGARAIVVLDASNTPTGIVVQGEVDDLTQSERAWTIVSEVSHPTSIRDGVDVNLSGPDLLDAVQARPAPSYLVLQANRPIGVLVSADLRAALAASPNPGAMVTRHD